ncbi:MAG: hypothetical protein LR017_04155 [Candidatus Pacebacteria bacterium]|nr:hypothetical protein [Candidatus Paceibacterota bacterium]
MTTLLKNLIFALGLAIILWLGYTLFVQEDEAVLDSQNGMVRDDVERETQEFLNRLQHIKTLDISNTLFTDSRFNALTDNRQEVIDEPTGRQNPFAPAASAASFE